QCIAGGSALRASRCAGGCHGAVGDGAGHRDRRTHADRRRSARRATGAPPAGARRCHGGRVGRIARGARILKRVRVWVRAGAVIALATVATAAVAAVADTARETRWAEQVVPQLVVGDAVWLAPPQQPRGLAPYTEPPKKHPEAGLRACSRCTRNRRRRRARRSSSYTAWA